MVPAFIFITLLNQGTILLITVVKKT